MPTGMIEVLGKEIAILAEAETPPFPLNDDFSNVGEEVRLKYRFLDMRRPEMLERMRFRSKVTSKIRTYLDTQRLLGCGNARAHPCHPRRCPRLPGAIPHPAGLFLCPAAVAAAVQAIADGVGL
jgi:hypothetical protein